MLWGAHGEVWYPTPCLACCTASKALKTLGCPSWMLSALLLLDSAYTSLCSYYILFNYVLICLFLLVCASFRTGSLSFIFMFPSHSRFLLNVELNQTWVFFVTATWVCLQILNWWPKSSCLFLMRVADKSYISYLLVAYFFPCQKQNFIQTLFPLVSLALYSGLILRASLILNFLHDFKSG